MKITFKHYAKDTINRNHLMTNTSMSNITAEQPMIEQWKDVKGYEGLYQVSSIGRVKSLRIDRMLKPNNHHEYNRVSLVKDGKKRNCLVHRLVAMAFIPNPSNKKQINHINKNRSDNRVDNIEWVTQRENTNHSYSFKKNRSSEYTGVTKQGDKWVSRYKENGIEIYLGIFKTEEEAATAYKNKMRETGQSIKYIK